MIADDLHAMRSVAVAVFDTVGEAELARLRLQDAGISCVISGTGTAGLPAAMFSGVAARVRIMVAKSDAEAARAVLEAE
ncbi:putative signal transducing protein [Longibacter sp.]|jgi:threonine dehydrogenase-like Zn-dependent dehydrogenase|uniref:putative signal transducing protein n=1 Tax=Longibacter sp. TaxID=2045415 RepID=UPI003EC127D2